MDVAIGLWTINGIHAKVILLVIFHSTGLFHAFHFIHCYYILQFIVKMQQFSAAAYKTADTSNHSGISIRSSNEEKKLTVRKRVSSDHHLIFSSNQSNVNCNFRKYYIIVNVVLLIATTIRLINNSAGWKSSKKNEQKVRVWNFECEFWKFLVLWWVLPAKNFLGFIFGVETFGCVLIGQQVVIFFFFRHCHIINDHVQKNSIKIAAALDINNVL